MGLPRTDQALIARRQGVTRDAGCMDPSGGFHCRVAGKVRKLRVVKFHVNSEGDARPCRARTRPCPYGGDEVHYPTAEEARAGYEASMREVMEHSRRWSTKLSLEDGSRVFVENQERQEESFAWLRNPEGVAVGMLHWSERAGAEAVICDIEVREAYRGKGYAKKLITTVEGLIGRKLHTTGGFTPEGLAALGNTPLAKGEYAKAEVHYRSMNFVEDWDRLYTLGG